ncbi:A-kinase anchor protein 10, mitochondrial [Sitophilus oryzae]|uniref:A-kinase anchor protein 10, mitochondrial n=1 Tax=Sitophilus oryzae TaxID=7048 RepID=A0A6J2YCW8_SITOR|nr:A-kinase anchor protein 10, mitochondrial [Sitophilus oryzae]
MLKFWKKTGHCSNNTQRTHSQAEYNTQPDTISRADFLTNVPLPLLEDEGLYDIDEFEATRERSRLSKSLDDILSDKSALSYFIQYMDVRNASCYILCYLDIEIFKSELQTSTDELKNQNNSPLPNVSEHDSLSVSTDCDSYTGDSSSLCECDSKTLCDVNNGNCVKIKLSQASDKLTELALVIFKKYIALESKLNIDCSEEMRKEIMENICSSEKVFSGQCFDSVQVYLFDLMKNEYFGAFVESDFFSKHQIDVLTSGNVVLDDLLYNETALFYFMEFLEQENKSGLLEFWIAATNLQQQLHNQKEFFDPVEAQNDAVVLYDKYFSLQAHCPLGFSDKVRFAVEQNICGENGLVIDCYHLPLKIVEQVLEKNYLKPFLASQLFYKYLSELINTVQASGYATSLEHKRYSQSDCSSEKSFSTSTFLALEIPYEKKKQPSTNMSIDTRELYDPDTLWKRKKSHRLSLGRVTDLGKYVADIEPEPDNKTFQLKNMVKKFVSLDEEERRKEEMAWQVAEMIVKDITNVTLNDNNV